MSIEISKYKPPGPIGAAYIDHLGPIDVIMGPGGSGKTVASCAKGPVVTAKFLPVCKDGWVRAKMLCTRDTYRSFAATALASWYNMFPISHPWTVKHEGGQDRPVKHTLQWETFRGPDKVRCEFIMETGAPGDFDIEAFFKGYEITLGWGNEIDLQHPNTLALMLQRCGRYPPLETIAESELARVSRKGREQLAEMGLQVDQGEIVVPRLVFGDLNPPDIDDPVYQAAFGEASKPGTIVRGVTPGWTGFWQPSGLAPNAENREGKPRSSYQLEEQTAKDKSLVRRMVHSLPAYAKDGRPVYEDYFDQVRHVADGTILPVPEWGLTIGIDGGGSPAATIGQPTPMGGDRLLAEVVSDPGTGPTRFGQMLLAVLMQQFPGIAVIGAWGDPSAWYGADKQTDEFHWMNTFMAASRINVLPAPSNEVSIRHEAVKHQMSMSVDGSRPGYLIDPRCKVMIGGYSAHYKHSKKNTAGETDKLAIVKNSYSHPQDAEQYRILGRLGIAALVKSASSSVLPAGVVNLQQQRLQRQAQPVQTDRMDFKI